MRYLTLPLVAVLPLVLGACPPTNPAECRDESSCDLRPGGVCVDSTTTGDWCAYPDGVCPGGMRYSERAGDGLAGVCVAEMIDAGVDAIDAAIDAPVDAEIANPIVTNNQLADLVVGQTNFMSEVDRGYSAQSARATGVAASAGAVWVVDEGRGRVLGFSPPPAAGDPVATGIVGRPALTDNTPIGAASASNLGAGLHGVGAGGGVLAVVDSDRNRVLIWNPAPTTAGEPADIVVGQPNMTSTTAGNGAGQLNLPYSVWTDGTRLVVTELLNRRVLLWNSLPTVNGQPADLVLGQTGFGPPAAVGSPTSSNMKAPSAALYDGARLYVADAAYNRVLVWLGWPNTTNKPADFVLGQVNLTSDADVAASALSLRGPSGLGRFADALLVADTRNHRIVIYQPLPTTNGASGSLVLGLESLQTVPPSGPHAASQATLDSPEALSIAGNLLYVADGGNRRVVRFTLRN